jgi:hypothetical protein
MDPRDFADQRLRSEDSTTVRMRCGSRMNPIQAEHSLSAIGTGIAAGFAS